MFSPKRVIRLGLPVAVLALGATVYAQARSNDCGHPSLLARAMRATGMAHIQPCAVVPGYDGEFCADVGHHCNVGNGPGKCRNVADPATNIVSCQCIVR
jgi:hypothetical protein